MTHDVEELLQEGLEPPMFDGEIPDDREWQRILEELERKHEEGEE